MPIKLIQDHDATTPSHEYVIAGHRVISDRKVECLTAFRVTPNAPSHLGYCRGNLGTRAGHLYYCGRHLVAGRQRTVEGRVDAAGLRLHIDGVAELWLVDNLSTIVVARSTPEVAPCLIDECLVGPGLILALAQRGVFCLHAAALAEPGAAIAVCGESGTGKSTLVTEDTPPGARIADDVLPIEVADAQVWACPEYPQLKWDADPPAKRRQTTRYALKSVLLLDPHTPGDQRELTVRSLSGRAAVLALVRHTVAAKLFPPDLLARHLAFCNEVAGLTPVRTLRYPKIWEMLPQVRQAAAQCLDGSTPHALG
ncbi:MAG: hypothetical protein OEQ18_09505 [Gammaproteobacteria bacterium]|nr:hypothetical protein [Gammaproteobacteria bacterium]